MATGDKALLLLLLLLVSLVLMVVIGLIVDGSEVVYSRVLLLPTIRIVHLKTT